VKYHAVYVQVEQIVLHVLRIFILIKLIKHAKVVIKLYNTVMYARLLLILRI
jgi:hypothetical protein